MSDPDVDHAREALAMLDHLVVQDIFLTETAISPTSSCAATAWPEKVGTVTDTDHIVQLGRKAIEPPGEAREDFWLLTSWASHGPRLVLLAPRDVFNEMRCAWTRLPASPGIGWSTSRR